MIIKPQLSVYGPEGEHSTDPDHHYYARREVDAILQAIFDPENQPSQFGTQLIDTVERYDCPIHGLQDGDECARC